MKSPQSATHLTRRAFLRGLGVGVVALALGPRLKWTTQTTESQPPMNIVFKIHIEPTSTDGRPPLAQRLNVYRERRDEVTHVAQLANAKGAKLSIHANGEFFEYVKEQNDQAIVQSWLKAGNHLGIHMHGVKRIGSHQWNTLPRQVETLERLRKLWNDHTQMAKEAFPDLKFIATTPYNQEGANFDTLMREFGFSILGGGRHEIAQDWLGHDPWQPWRPGLSGPLSEDLSRPYVLIPHRLQIESAASHGPPPFGVFQDNRVAHSKVQFLQCYLERLARARAGLSAKVWVFGILHHDNGGRAGFRPGQADPVITAILDWFNTHFVGKPDVFHQPIARYANFNDIAAEYREWEEKHPKESSFLYQQGQPYPYRHAGLASALKATQTRVVDYIEPVTLWAAQGVSAHRLGIGPRPAGGSEPDPKQLMPYWLLWKEQGDPITLDASALLGRSGNVRVIDGVTGKEALTNATNISVGPDPLLITSSS